MLRNLLSPESLARLDRRQAEVTRMYGLTTPWLASAILKLGRNLRAELAIPLDDSTYDSSLVWGIIPELVRRLGPVKLDTAEIDWTVRDLSDYELRQRLGNTLKNVSRRRCEGWELLTEEAANGNPLVMAIDRLIPGVVGDNADSLTRSLAEIAGCRGVPFAGIWTPAMLGKPKAP